jgi:hypothetical protein
VGVVARGTRLIGLDLYLIPAARSLLSVSSDKMYVRSGKTMPGDWRRMMGSALASCFSDKRMTTFMESAAS